MTFLSSFADRMASRALVPTSDDLADLNPLASIVSGERYRTDAAKLAER
jgi:hypothetical protein